MAISDTITSMQNHLKNAYDKVSEKGGTLPNEKNMANLSEAIGSVPSGDNTLLNSLIDRSITEISNDEVTSVGAYTFYNCSKLTSVNLSKCLSIGSLSCAYCSSLTAFIITTTSRACTLTNTDAFTNTPIATSTTEGFIYVPDDLVESYRDATNWTTYKTKIMPISFVEGSYQEVDLGTLNWTYVGGNYTAYSSGLQSIIQTPQNYSKMCNLMCSNYQTLPEGNLTSTDKSIALTSSGLILINDASLGTSASAVKTALSGIKLKYLLKGE